MKRVFQKPTVGRAGFSLIEILVATTILLIIVMLMSMVFQQSSGAYQSGTSRVNAQKVLRNIMGVIARDLALAVDSRYYPGLKNQFDANRVGVVALTGNADDTGRRTPQWIEFSYLGARVSRGCHDLKWDAGGKKWSTTGSAQTSVLNPDDELLEFNFVIDPSDDPESQLPRRVDVYGKLATSGKFSFIRGRSAGKDRAWNTDDDIVVGGQ
jgi:prepilin-type N-terminal cleavage/methylation domain-containing protein